MEIIVTNVNHALAEGISWLLRAGVEEPSRNGPVLVSPEPVMVTYTRPLERVLFSPLRDANPFFHLMESLWILAGRNDMAWPVQFNKNFTQYSDDGIIQPGAYGHRWRYHFGYDQLEAIALELERHPESRRCVLGMWDAGVDPARAAAGGKDVPCNTQAYFDLRNGKLNLTVLNRSNDLVWGLAGANSVQFSLLLEYLATKLKVEPGEYRQFTNNLHLYLNVYPRETLSALANDAATQDRYLQKDWRHFPLALATETWDADLKHFLEVPTDLVDYKEPFFPGVAAPMYAAWVARKLKKSVGVQLDWVTCIAAPDWRTACSEWILRRRA